MFVGLPTKTRAECYGCAIRSRAQPPVMLERARNSNAAGVGGGTRRCGGNAGVAVIDRVGEENTGIMDERVLLLVFRFVNWDPLVLSVASCVSRRLRAVAKRLLWRELCIARAPRMVSALTGGGARIGGGWHALAKLFFYCCGCAPSRRLQLERQLPGHFVEVSRFSKTSGKSFLPRRCWGDLLYVCDPCEHAMGGEEDVGVYRGVFRGFMRSRTRACLIERQAELDPRVRCPYCGARVWSMTAARLVPRSASRRLGSHEGSLEYFVCVYGHLHGNCWLARLSTDEDSDGGDDDEEMEDNNDDEDDDDDDDDDGDDNIAC